MSFAPLKAHAAALPRTTVGIGWGTDGVLQRLPEKMQKDLLP